MIKNKNSVGESVADEMAACLSSDAFQAVFVRTAAKKEDKKEEKKAPPKGKKPKHNHDEDAKCGKKCPVFMAKKADDLQSAVDTLSKISEVLDEYGFDKTAAASLTTLHILASEAKDEEEKDKKDENDAKDVVVEVNDCDMASADALLTDEERAAALNHSGVDHATTNPPVHPGIIPEATQHSVHNPHKNPYADKAAPMVFDAGNADDGDSKKADAQSEEVSGEELRALLQELGLGSSDESHADDMIVEASLAVDDEFASDYADLYNLPKEASFRDAMLKLAAEKSKPKGEFVFPKDHPKVTDNKDHFPINTEGRGRNAIARANQTKKAPSWYKGTVEQFLDTVVRAVKKKYKGIEVSPAGKKPGKG